LGFGNASAAEIPAAVRLLRASMKGTALPRKDIHSL
jgi:hypothetical protein